MRDRDVRASRQQVCDLEMMDRVEGEAQKGGRHGRPAVAPSAKDVVTFFCSFDLESISRWSARACIACDEKQGVARRERTGEWMVAGPRLILHA